MFSSSIPQWQSPVARLLSPLFPMIVLLLVVFWLGARQLNVQMIWDDERWSIWHAGGAPYGAFTWAQVWQQKALESPRHPPGYFMLLNSWGTATGWAVVTQRALSLLFGALTLATTYRLGRDLVSPRVGLLAAFLLAVGALYLRYTYELRAYTLHTWLCVFVIWVYLHLVRRRYRAGFGWWLALGLGAVAQVYVDYVAALPLVAVGLYHLVAAPKVQGWWRVVAVGVLVALAFVPWLRVAVGAVGAVADDEWLNAQALAPAALVFTALATFSGGQIGLLVVAAAGLLLAWRERGTRQIVFFTAVVLATLVLLNVVLRFIIPTRTRYLLVVFPLLALAAAVGFAALARRTGRARPLVWGLVALWGVFSLTDTSVTANLYSGQYIYPMHHVAAVLSGQAQPGDALMHLLPPGLQRWNHHQFVAYYFAGWGLSHQLVETDPADAEAQAVEQTVARAFASAPEHERLWLAYMPAHAPPALDALRADLRAGYALCPVTLVAPEARIEQYVRDPVCCASVPYDQPVLMRFGDGIRLTAASTLPDVVAERLSVTLGWQLAPDVVPHTYSVGVHIEDAASGALLAQADYGLRAQTYDCRPLTLDLQALAPGVYRAALLVYAWQTGERLPAVAASGATGDRLVLGTFTVE